MRSMIGQMNVFLFHPKNVPVSTQARLIALINIKTVMHRVSDNVEMFLNTSHAAWCVCYISTRLPQEDCVCL